MDFSFRRVVALFVLASALVVFRPQPVEAQWSAMLPKVIEQVQLGIDTWERHARILEDHLDNVTGVLNPFSALGSLFPDHRRLLSNIQTGFSFGSRLFGATSIPPRVVDLLRASRPDESCFDARSFAGPAPCAVGPVPDATEFQQVRWSLPFVSPAQRALLRGPTGLANRDVEADIDTGWGGFRPALSPGSVADVVADVVPGYLDSVTAERQAYHRTRELSRRVATLADSSRRAARQVLTDPRRTGLLQTAGYDGICGGGPPATTLLGAAYDADCEPPEDPPSPRGGDYGRQNLSEMEVRQLELQTMIVNATLIASRLEHEAILQESGLQVRAGSVDLAREQMDRYVQKQRFASGNGPANCQRTSAYVDQCLSGTITLLSDAEQAQLATDLAVHP